MHAQDLHMPLQVGSEALKAGALVSPTIHCDIRCNHGFVICMQIAVSQVKGDGVYPATPYIYPPQDC